MPENQTVYNYDGVGNRTTVVENGLTTTYYYYPGTNKLQRTANANESVSYSYDGNGNVTSKITQKGTVQTWFDYMFNSLNQLVQVKKDGVNWYAYCNNPLSSLDPNGEKVVTTTTVTIHRLRTFKQPISKLERKFSDGIASANFILDLEMVGTGLVGGITAVLVPAALEVIGATLMSRLFVQ